MSNKQFRHSILAGLAGFTLACLLIAGANEHNYKRKARVTDVDNNIITCEDVSGNEWVFKADNLQKYEWVELKMNDNGTIEDITDDTVAGYKKAG